MTRTTRFAIFTMPTLVAAGWLSAAGCSSSNDPATPGTGGGSGTGGSAGTDTAGGSAGTGGSGTGGSTGGSGGAAGSGTGGAGTGGAGAGGSGGGATGGSAGTAGAGAGGSSDAGSGTFASMYGGPCGNTTATPPVAIAKGVACTATDPQTCSRTCGPESKGLKSETCTLGAYAEEKGSPCAYDPAGNFACYKIPAAIDAKCPTTPPQSSSACDVPACTVCNAGGATPQTGTYLDSTNATKVGYCVCPEAKMVGGSRKWTCASTTAWPCPEKTGCQ